MTDTSTATTPSPLKLSPEEASQITSLHRQAQEIVQNVGQLEVRKQRLLGSLSEIEERAHAFMQSAASKLGIPAGTAWRVTPDGTVVILPDPSQTSPQASPR